MTEKVKHATPAATPTDAPTDFLILAWRASPSGTAGKWNIKHPTNPTLNLSIDPNGAMSWSPNDANYEQFTRNGMAMEIAPGDDHNARAPRFIFLPK